MVSDKNLFKSLFFIQIFASFLVYVGHYAASASTHVTPTQLETSLRHLSAFGTVLLAMLTGFFTAHSFEGKKIWASKFFNGKFFFIYAPFLFFGIVFDYALLGGSPDFKYHFMNILLGKSGAHLYFIFMICQYYIFAYLFRNVITKKTGGYFLLLFMVIQFFFAKQNINWNGLGVRHFLLTWIFTIYLGHFIYWYRQEFVSRMMDKKLLSYCMLIVTIISMVYFAFSSNLYTANHLRFVFASFLILLTGMRFVLPVLDHFKKLRFRKGLTLYIYLAHPFFILYANNYVIKKFGFLWVLENKAIFLVYMLAVYGVTFLCSYVWTGFLENRTAPRKQAKESDVYTAA